jgi:uncharacterized phage protein (TIGR02218 family)
VKSTPAGLLAHYAQDTQTTCLLWRVDRRDGQTFGFTSLDIDVPFEGVNYVARTGFGASAIESKIGGAPTNLEIVGVLDSSAITAADIEAGLWDEAKVTLMRVNYIDTSQGADIVGGGRIGQITIDDAMHATVELIGIGDRIQNNIGRVITSSCQHLLGDAACGVALGAYTFTAAITSVASRRSFAAASLTQAAGYFANGLVIFTSGLNTGLKFEVAAHSAGGALITQLSAPRAIAIGDGISIIAGCRKRFQDDCIAKFSNGPAFGGFPYTPGNNAMLTPNVSQ